MFHMLVVELKYAFHNGVIHRAITIGDQHEGVPSAGAKPSVLLTKETHTKSRSHLESLQQYSSG